MHEITGDVTPNNDQLPVLQQSWKEKVLPALRKILVILYITWVYSRGKRILHISHSFVYICKTRPRED